MNRRTLSGCMIMQHFRRPHARSASRVRALVVVIALATIATSAPVFADSFELRWAAEGYYRTRSIYLTNLARAPRSTGIDPVSGETFVVPEIRRTSYLMHRLRLAPRVAVGRPGEAPLATLFIQLDALDDVLWGDNNGVSSAPLFATETSNQSFLGGSVEDSVQIGKAWVEFGVPVGAMRVGRMPSHWGMGLLANGGGSTTFDPDPNRPADIPARRSSDAFFNDDFGDNHFGSVADRILFVTKPLTIYRTVAGFADTESKLVVGYAFDKISEAPFLVNEPFERRFRPFGQQAFISRGASDDVNEHVGLVVWNDPYWKPGGPLARHTDELRVGAYGVLRLAEEGSTEPTALDPADSCGVFEGEPVPCVDTGSTVWIADLWYRLRYGPFYSEGEVLRIGGTTFGGVPFPATNTKKRASITGGVLRFGFFGTDYDDNDLWDATLEVGHASGDDQLEDEKFKQRPLHPDYNVGLILYEEILRELSARTYGIPFFSTENPEGATGFFSNGGVINSNYLFLKGGYHLPLPRTRLVGGLLLAWVDTLAQTGVAMFYEGEGGSYLGTELDLALKTSFSGNMDLSIETGYLRFGSALRAVYPNAEQSFTLQSRLAFIF
jgi:hypothetical protein